MMVDQHAMAQLALDVKKEKLNFDIKPNIALLRDH